MPPEAFDLNVRRSVPPSSALITQRPKHSGGVGVEVGGRGAGQPTGRRRNLPCRREEPTEMVDATLIKHENTISWLINRGKTPAFISQHNPKAPQKHVGKAETSCKNIHAAAFIISQLLRGWF